MIGLLAYVALVIVVPALLLGHQGQDFPPWRWWRALRAVWPRRAVCAPAGGPQGVFVDSRDVGTPPGAPQAPSRHTPAWAHTRPLTEEN